MKNFRIFNITAIPFNPDLLSGILWEFDLLGINELDNSLQTYVAEDSKIDLEKIKVQLNKLIKEHLIESFTITEEILENKNWNEVWESKVNVIEINDKLVIKPSFREYKPKDGQIVITIDPKMSFGTGEHQTTKIMLKLLEKYLDKNMLVLDVGSGTAILAIAASKLGAKKVLAIDNDEWCFINGIENVEVNKITNVDVKNCEIDDIHEDNFELILANLNKIILLNIKEKLCNKIKPGGLIILSGILKEDELEIKRQFTNFGLTALEIEQMDEWIGIVLKKETF